MTYLPGIDTDLEIPRNDSACSPVSTVFVTVPASPTTETIFALSKGSIATAGIEALANGAAQVTSTAATMTVNTSVISTLVISVIQASSPSEGQGAYSFTEENGTTTWLGETPPISASLITSTQVVTVQPVPLGYVAPPVEITPVTSYLTLSSTETITQTLTETQTLAIATASAPAGAYTGLAASGWNSSMLTFITVKTPGIGSVAEKLAYFPSTAYPIAPSGIVSFSPGNATRHKKARDVADIVDATIDGVAVSWTNNYDGPSVSTSGIISSPVQTGSSPPTAPTTTAGAYASEVLPTPSPTSTSLSPVAQLTTSHAFSSPLYSNTSTASGTAITATASSCSDASADFIIDFDDLPAFSAGPGVCKFRSPCTFRVAT